jgi:hypothetical protein
MKTAARYLGLILLAGALVLPGCGGGDDPSDLQKLQSCLEDRLPNLLACLVGFDPLLAAALDPSQAGLLGITYTEVQGLANAYDFDVPIDTDFDGSADASITGRITFSSDPIGGIAPGTTAAVVWSIAGSGSGVGGSGTFDLVFASGDTVEVSGTGTVTEASGNCVLDFMIPANDPLEILLPGAAPAGTGPRLQIQDPETGLEVTGGVDLGLTMGANVASALASFAQGSNSVQVDNVMFNGNPLPPFSLNLPFGNLPTPGWVTFVLVKDGTPGVSVLHSHVSFFELRPEGSCSLWIYDLDKPAEHGGALWGTGSIPTGGSDPHIGWHQWLIDAAGPPVACWGFGAQFTVEGVTYVLHGDLWARPEPGQGTGVQPVAAGFWAYEGDEVNEQGSFEYYDRWIEP